MTDPSPDLRKRQSSWAAPVDRLTAPHLPDGAVNLNVDGRQLTGLTRGFGQLLQKTYRARLEGIKMDPTEVIQVWKDNFPSFWPKGNRFYGTGGQIAPGEVAVLNLAGPNGMTGPGGSPLISTGIMVIYADDESFTFMTPQGHMFAGMITFSAFEEDGVTVAQAQALIRASDPLYEISFRLGVGHKMEDAFWMATLTNLAHHLGAQPVLSRSMVKVDPRVQWSEARNVWQNAAIRTLVYQIAQPFRWVGRQIGGKKTQA